MTKIETVRAAMVAAMKAQDKPRKNALSMLLSALKNAEIDQREPLTDQIREVIAQVLAELNIEAPAAKDKGAIMKVLMPRVKGKADGKVVNETLASMMK